MAGASVAGACDLVGNDLLGSYICIHLFEIDYILVHLITYDCRFSVGKDV